MRLLEQCSPEVVSAYGGPTITISDEAVPYMQNLEVRGPLIWHILRNGVVSSDSPAHFPGLTAAQIAKLNISFEGMSDDVKEQLSQGADVKGVVKGASYEPTQKHIRVFAGNIGILDRVDAESHAGQGIKRMDRAFRLALGRFVHNTYHAEQDDATEDVMISQYDENRTDADWARYRVKTPSELFRRQALISDIWPAFTQLPVALASVAFLISYNRQARQDRIYNSVEQAKCSDLAAFYYELGSRGSSLLGSKDQRQGT